MTREAQSLLQRLDDVTRSRHEKFGNTGFPSRTERQGHPRPVCGIAMWRCALSLLSSIDKLHDWPDPNSPLSAAVRKQFEPALDFLMSVRCFLHLRSGRDDNLLSWEAQEKPPNSDRNVRFARTLGRRLDADLFRPRPLDSSHRNPVAGRNPGGLVPLSRHFHNCGRESPTPTFPWSMAWFSCVSRPPCKIPRSCSGFSISSPIMTCG